MICLMVGEEIERVEGGQVRQAVSVFKCLPLTERESETQTANGTEEESIKSVQCEVWFHSVLFCHRNPL